MNIDLQTAFKRANAVLNRTQLRLSTPELSLRIHYWGFMPQHYDNENHRHSFLEACYVMEGISCSKYSFIPDDLVHV